VRQLVILVADFLQLHTEIWDLPMESQLVNSRSDEGLGCWNIFNFICCVLANCVSESGLLPPYVYIQRFCTQKLLVDFASPAQNCMSITPTYHCRQPISCYRHNFRSMVWYQTHALSSHNKYLRTVFPFKGITVRISLVFELSLKTSVFITANWIVWATFVNTSKCSEHIRMFLGHS
jgi:hypothetical protein